MHNHHNDQLLHVEMTCGSLLSELQVADFGLTKLTEVGSSSLHTRLVGTFGYMASEFQVHGDGSLATLGTLNASARNLSAASTAQVILSGSTSVRGVLEDAGTAVFSSPINISNSAKEEKNANFPGCRSSPALAETGLKGIGRDGLSNQPSASISIDFLPIFELDPCGADSHIFCKICNIIW
ncbi:hypothetical protein F0562_015686 [Nyssa sinensis]|uniref:Protein kinase domain-containing protein n=1 Tax=Nyssa sinensis TaxID=561372 RepID=A0A5J4ZL14_9ASTE|nr:hypothetical protein F0562_015686 [Nyssa sinensis]